MTQKIWIGIGLAGLTFAVMFPVVFCEFINFDDPLYVTSNPYVLTGLTAESLRWSFTDACSHAGFWFPLTWTSLQLDATLFGRDGAWGFHLVNLLLHIASVVLFFLALQRMTGDLWRSAAAAALFAVHPLRVESVAWITERKDVLGVCFLLLTVTAYVWYAERPGWQRYGVLLATYVLGLMCKVTLITLPFALLLLDYWPLYRLRLGQTIPANRAAKPGVPWTRLAVEKAPLLFAAVVISLIDLHFVRNLGSVHSIAKLPFGSRMATALCAYLQYLEKTILPINLGLLYPVETEFPPGYGLLAIGALVAITLLVFWLRCRVPALIVGWLWFLGTLVPLNGIVQVGPQAMADRFTYIPHLGLMIMLVWGVSSLQLWRGFSTFLQKSLVGLTLFALGSLTMIQVCHWLNTQTILEHTLSVTQGNYTVEAALGGYYHMHGRLDEAEAHTGEAVKIHPTDYYRRFYAAVLLDREEFHRAIEQLQESLRTDPNNGDAHYFLAVALAKTGKFADAQRHVQKALKFWELKRLPIDQFDIRTQLAGAHRLMGGFELRAGQAQAALDHFALAHKLMPNLQTPHEWVGMALGRLGRWEEAEREFYQALDVNPEDPTIHAYIAYAIARQGKSELAAKRYADLLRRSPDWPATANAFAMELITTAEAQDIGRARELAEQICAATENKKAEFLDTLAATYAASGDFTRACDTAKKALSLTEDAALKQQLQERLARYERGQPLAMKKAGN